MRIAVRQLDAATVVEPQGRIDSESAKAFTERLTELVAAGNLSILIDLRQVQYISSAGFRSLVIAGKLLDERGGRLAVCELTAEILRLFEISSFDELIVIYATQEEGVAKATLRE